MQCIICHSDEIQKRKLQEDFQLGDDIVRIPVEVLICRNCGERYYDRRTVRYLEDIERKVKAGKIPLKQAGRVLVQDVV